MIKKLSLSIIAIISAMFSSNANAQDAATEATEKVETTATAQADTKPAEEKIKEPTDIAAATDAPATDAAATPATTAAEGAVTTAENPATVENPAATVDLANTLVMTLKDGAVIIKLRPDLAPNHVARILDLTKQGFYNGVVFHRVIDGFMAQTGDPTGTGRGGSGQKINAEFSAEKHVRGTVSMARAADPNSADSQFYIMFADAPHLDSNYTIFGGVVSGMELIDKIKKGAGPNGMVTDPDKIISLKVASDMPAEELPESLKGAAVAPVDGAAPLGTTPADGAAAPATEGTAPATDAATPAVATGTAPATPAAVPADAAAKPVATDPSKPASMQETAPKQ